MKCKRSIADCLMKECPVILIVKYNSLFYNPYFRNNLFKSNHGIIVNEFNQVNNTFAIKEATLLRDSIKNNGNKEVHFQLHITDEMLLDIINISNKQFINEDSQYQNSIYYIKKNKEQLCDNNLFIKDAIEIFSNKKDDLINYITKENLINRFCESYRYYRMRFFGSLKVIFEFIDKRILEAGMEDIEFKQFENLFCENRNKILNELYMVGKRKQNITDENKERFCDKVNNDDSKLIAYMRKVEQFSEYKNYTNYYIDLKEYYNNKAFENKIQDNSVADITGEGTYFLGADISSKNIWNKSKYSFKYDCDFMGFDNISCDNQKIDLINISDIASKIVFLGCAEYGSYIEKCKVIYWDGIDTEIQLMFSDFYQPAIYDEYLFWSGVALNRTEGKTQPHNFSARLFAKEYSVPTGKIKEIILPNRKNIHIFALTILCNS